jgi:ribonucleoside-diphosphate reductase beta chain
VSTATNGNANQRAALLRMAEKEPELAARLVIQSMPAAVAGAGRALCYGLEIEGVGSYRIESNGEDGPPTVRRHDGHSGPAEFVIRTDPATLAELAAGASPVKLMLSRRLRLHGSRRKAMALRRLNGDAGLREVAALGAPIDPDLVYRSLPYAIDPEWTRGHNFSVGYELTGPGGGTWYVHVGEGSVRVTEEPPVGGADAHVRIALHDWLALLRGDMTPAQAMQEARTEVLGSLWPVTLLGRWLDRADGRDDAELEREERQREVQRSRAGAWGSVPAAGNGKAPSAPGMGDPGHDAEERRRARGQLMGYQELYALWERQNWRVHELDFEVDKQHWLTTPAEAQRHTAWTMGSFYVGEERVTADLAPFLMAAPSGEVEVFLSTQLVDEARHAAFFDRFAAEVMALSADDLRGRLKEMEDTMLSAWHVVFDDSLREVANRIKARPDDLELFVEGITTYHMVIEGVLAMTGQRAILQYIEEHSLYPGFHRGFSLVEQDEHRHIAFGARFLKDVCAEHPEYRATVERVVCDLVPKAVHVFVPPEAGGNAADFHSYGYHSSQIYGYAYKALSRRMAAIGVEIPGPEDLMPGPVDLSGLPSQRLAPAA